MIDNQGNMQTFGEHLDVLRKMLFRIVVISFCIAVCLIGLKESMFNIILAPCSSDFTTFQFINSVLKVLGTQMSVYDSQIELIATDVSSQFMAHLSVSLYVGILFSSPYIVYELFKFISPALYDNEKKYSFRIVISAYLLFVLGLLVSYFLLFPISCRFLATYSVSSHIHTMITLDSYLSLFLSLTLTMGIIFQLPVLSFFLAKMDLLDSKTMKEYRKHAFILILLIAAIITPPDAMTLLLVSLPLYTLYELSITVVRISKR